MSAAPAFPPLEQDLPPEALRVLALATRLTTPTGENGADIVWHTWGNDRAEPLVLLHGGSGSWTHWIRNVEALAAAGRRVIVPDLPGFGDSARPPGGQDADVVAPCLTAGLRLLLGDAAADVAGFSFGGLVGALMAAGQPDAVRRLVLIGAPGLGLRSKRLPLTSWREQPTREGQRAAHRSNLATLMLARDASIDDLAVSLQAANVPRDRMHRRKLALTDILVHTLPRIRCRIDAIYGEEDALYRETLAELEQRLQAAPTLGELVFIPRAGHWVQYEDAPALNAALLSLLAS